MGKRRHSYFAMPDMQLPPWEVPQKTVPAVLGVIAENIPERLKQNARWVVWKAVVKDDGKITKPPYQARHPGLKASTNNIDHLATFDEAIAACRNRDDVAGIGYVTRPEDGLTFVDMDGCMEDDEPDAEAQAALNAFASYAERSPSGNGIRVIAEARIPHDFTNRAIRREMYAGNGTRYLTITGQIIDGFETIENAQEAISYYHERWDSNRTKKADALNIPDEIAESVDLSRLHKHTRDIIDGDYSSFEDETGKPDRSNAVLAVASDMLRMGYEYAEILRVLSHPDYTIAEVALSRRGGDIASAADWIVKYTMPEAKARAELTANITVNIEAILNNDRRRKEERANEKFDLIWASEARGRSETASLVRGLISPESMIVTYGESNSGKTFHVIDRDMRLAAGLNWYDRETTGGFVLYVAAESPRSVEVRVSVYRDRLLEGSAPPLAILPQPVDLLRPDVDVDDLVRFIKRVEDQRGVKCIKVTADTLARVMAGGNENSSEDMGALVRNADVLRHQVGCAFEFIHHSGKDTAKGARGHSSLRAATDTEIEVVANDGLHLAKVTKQRDFAIGESFGYRLEVVQLGFDSYGYPVTTCVPTWVMDAVEVRQHRLGKNDARLLKYIHSALSETRRLPPNDIIRDGKKGPKPGQFAIQTTGEFGLREFVEKVGGITGSDSRDTEKRSFYRSLKNLQDYEYIGNVEGWIWLRDK